MCITCWLSISGKQILLRQRTMELFNAAMLHGYPMSVFFCKQKSNSTKESTFSEFVICACPVLHAHLISGTL